MKAEGGAVKPVIEPPGPTCYYKNKSRQQESILVTVEPKGEENEMYTRGRQTSLVVVSMAGNEDSNCAGEVWASFPMVGVITSSPSPPRRSSSAAVGETFASAGVANLSASSPNTARSRAKKSSLLATTASSLPVAGFASVWPDIIMK